MGRTELEVDSGPRKDQQQRVKPAVIVKSLVEMDECPQGWAGAWRAE